MKQKCHKVTDQDKLDIQKVGYGTLFKNRDKRSHKYESEVLASVG